MPSDPYAREVADSPLVIDAREAKARLDPYSGCSYSDRNLAEAARELADLTVRLAEAVARLQARLNKLAWGRHDV